MSGMNSLAASLLYAAPLALLALLLISPARRPRWVLAAALTALPVFYIGHYELAEALQGWPSDAAVPDDFRMLAFDVREPDPQRDSGGEILLWLRSTPDATPRVHRLPYSKGLHEKLVAANQLQAGGSPQIGTRGARTEAAGGDMAAPRDLIEFRPEPRPTLPAKDDRD